MSTTTSERIDSSVLTALAEAADLAVSCASCQPILTPGWDSLPSSFDRQRLRRVGTARQEGLDEPTLDEYHPDGTHGWSANAPIALACYPYNRCEVWQCSACRRAYLRYTEYGGYYEDERVRWVDPTLIVHTGN